MLYLEVRVAVSQSLIFHVQILPLGINLWRRAPSLAKLRQNVGPTLTNAGGDAEPQARWTIGMDSCHKRGGKIIRWRHRRKDDSCEQPKWHFSPLLRIGMSIPWGY